MLLSRNAEEVRESYIRPTRHYLKLAGLKAVRGDWKQHSQSNQQVFSRAIHWRNITHSVADLLKKYSFEKPVSAVLKILRDVIWRRKYRHGGRLCKWLVFLETGIPFWKSLIIFILSHIFFTVNFTRTQWCSKATRSCCWSFDDCGLPKWIAYHESGCSGVIVWHRLYHR